jgi:hypothetical protein
MFWPGEMLVSKTAIRRKSMPRLRLFCTCGVWFLVVGLVGWSAIAAAAPETQLLSGEFWQTMSPDTKVAYILGIGNLVDFEAGLAEPLPPERRSFLPWLVKGMSGKSVNEVIRTVDVYYREHPDQLKHPVLEVVLRATVLPGLTISQSEGGRQ